MDEANGIFDHKTKVTSPEFPSVLTKQPPVQHGERTGFQAIITSSWVLRWAAMPTTYAFYRQVRKHPTIALARTMAVAPVLAAEWSIKSKDGADPEWIHLVQDTFFPLRERFLEAALFYGNVDFGYQGFEKVFKQEGGYEKLTKLKPLLQDITEICIGHKGEFVGFRQWGTELGLANAVHVGFRVEGSYLYGIPLLENIREAYNDWMECNAGAKRYDRHVAGAHWVVQYPDVLVTHNGVANVPAGQVARELLHTLESAGGAAVPRDVAAWMNQLGTNDPGWIIDLKATGTQEQAGFVDRLNYLDKQLCRGVLLPERSVLEGTHGTKQEAETHLDAAMVTKDLEHRYCTAELNRQVVDEVLVLNFGEAARGQVELEASPIVDSKREFFKDLYQQVLSNPQSAVEEFQKMDLDAMRDALGIPKSKETDKTEQGPEGSGDDPGDRPGPDGQPPKGPAGFSNVIRLDAKSDKSGGHWITIGSDHEGGGGAKVFVGKGGQIEKGPKSLTGKNIKHLKEHLPASGQKDWKKKWQRSDKLQDINAGKRAELDDARARIRQEAEENDVDPEMVENVAKEMHGQRMEQFLYREAAKAHAREMTGITARTIGQIENARHRSGDDKRQDKRKYKGADWTAVPGIDTAAVQIAREYPGLIGRATEWEENHNRDEGNEMIENLWNLIREGKQTAPAWHHPDIVNDAMHYVLHSRDYAGVNEPEPEYAEFSNRIRAFMAGRRSPFGITLSGLFDDQEYTRDAKGQFAEKASEKAEAASEAAGHTSRVADDAKTIMHHRMARDSQADAHKAHIEAAEAHMAAGHPEFASYHYGRAHKHDGQRSRHDALQRTLPKTMLPGNIGGGDPGAGGEKQQRQRKLIDGMDALPGQGDLFGKSGSGSGNGGANVATDDAGDDEQKRLKQSACARVASELIKHKELPQALRKQYQEAAEQVINGMGTKALELWHTNLRGIRFFPSTDEIDALARIEDPEAASDDYYPAFTKDGTPHINGGSEGNARASRAAKSYYAHEFAHVIDKRGAMSKTAEWSQVWKESKAAIDALIPRRKTRSLAEGFADCGIAAWLYPEWTKRNLPEYWSQLSVWGLV